MAFISNGTTMLDAGAFSVGLGSMVHIKTLTGSDQSNFQFVHGSSSVVFDSTYPIYRFFYQFNPASNQQAMTFNVSQDTGSNYNVAKTSTYFISTQREDGSNTQVAYETQADLAQGTSGQFLNIFHGNAADELVTGHITFFNPSSTTFAKNFMATTSYNETSSTPGAIYANVAGYCNTTSAIDAVKFEATNGNFDGTVKLYGIKNS
jgi:hypothetical protein